MIFIQMSTEIGDKQKPRGSLRNVPSLHKRSYDEKQADFLTFAFSVWYNSYISPMFKRKKNKKGKL